MRLNRPTLVVAPGPLSVHRARRWVVESVNRLGRAELAETSELGVSELVTNAVLHGEPPITLRMGGTHAHPRVEVRDGSTEPPVLPLSEPLDLDVFDTLEEGDLPATVGRGLGIVARCADAWGAVIEDDGKVVWFTPARSTSDEGRPGTISGIDGSGTAPSDATAPYRILGAPLRDLTGFGQHYRELSREVQLLALAHESEYPLAQSLADMFGSMERQLREGIDNDEVQAAMDAGRSTVDLTFRITPDSAATMSRFVELLDFADDFCREERLLALARTPAQREFETWFLTELVRQSAGAQPLPWGTGTGRAQA